MKWVGFTEILEGLLDWRFEKAVTPLIIRALYAIGWVLALVMTVNYIAAGFQVNQIYGILAILISGFVFAFFVLLLRVVLEILMALFKGASVTYRPAVGNEPIEESEVIESVATEVTEKKKSVSAKKQE